MCRGAAEVAPTSAGVPTQFGHASTYEESEGAPSKKPDHQSWRGDGGREEGLGGPGR